MPGTQSTLDPHLARQPRRRARDESQYDSSQAVEYPYDLGSDSEGSEGLAAVRLSPEKKDRALLSTQDRRRVMDSDDEEAADRALDADDVEDEQEEDDDAPEVVIVEDDPEPESVPSRRARSQRTQTKGKDAGLPARGRGKAKEVEAIQRPPRPTRAAAASKIASTSRPARSTRAAKSQASLPAPVARSSVNRNRAYVELRSLSPAIRALYRYSDGTLHETPEPQASAGPVTSISGLSPPKSSGPAVALTLDAREEGLPSPISAGLEKTASPDKGKRKAVTVDLDEADAYPSPVPDDHILPTVDPDDEDDEEDDLPGPSRRRLAIPVPRDPDDSDDSDYPAPALKTKRANADVRKSSKQSKHATHYGSKRHRPGRSSPVSKKKLNKKRRTKDRYRDPDDSDNVSAETEEEDMLAELQQDEPERFNSSTRLRARPKETAMQRNIRKLANRRKGIEETTTPEESSEEEEQTSESGTVLDSDSDESEDFIVDDGGLVEDGLLPHEFSLNSAQTPEFKFKVVFQYFVLLVVKGPKILPLRGEAASYMLPQLEDLRRKIKGWRDSRVRSQIWRAPLVASLQRYPQYIEHRLEYTQEYCEACNRHNFKSVYRVELKGKAYNRETFKPLETVSNESEEESDASSSSASPSKSRRVFISGSMCCRRTKVYHNMSHWEYRLWAMVRGWYNNMLRAKAVDVPSDSGSSAGEASDSHSDGMAERRRQRRLRRNRAKEQVTAMRRKPLPKAHKDVDEVTQWMDTMMYTNSAWKWMEQLIKDGEQLDFAED